MNINNNNYYYNFNYVNYLMFSSLYPIDYNCVEE